MEYKERLVCFVDLLGFGEAIKQSIEEPALAERFFQILGEFKDGGLEKVVYGSIPILDEKGLSNCGQAFGESVMDRIGPHYDLVATQFSDSFVLSVPAGNKYACALLVRALAVIQLQFFFSLGMLMRGGIAVGKLAHERGGVLFGPAMNEAYELESKSAIYARVVSSPPAAELLKKALSGGPLEPAFFVGFDGFTAFDLVSVISCEDFYRPEEPKFADQLGRVEEDILARTAKAYPKVAYLKSRLASVSK